MSIDAISVTTVSVAAATAPAPTTEPETTEAVAEPQVEQPAVEEEASEEKGRGVLRLLFRSLVEFRCHCCGAPGGCRGRVRCGWHRQGRSVEDGSRFDIPLVGFT